MTKYDVLVVGIPKSGTQMVKRACELLGANPSPHMHTGNYHLSESNKVVYVYRNPRNVLISAIRYKNHQVRGLEDTITEDKLIETFFNFFNTPLNAVYKGYEKWFRSNAHCLRYEYMVEGIAANGLADYLGVARIHDMKARLAEGGTYTWTGKPSDWKDHWTERFGRIWEEEGMLDIERSLGYVNRG